MSRTPFLLRDRGGPARLISPFTGLMLLTCAACLVFLGELVLNGERAGETELVPIEGGGEEVAEGEVTGAVPNGESSLIGNKAATIIRRIPVVGDRIADSFQNTNSVNTRQVVANAPKVKVDFYMEALCPGCQYFTTHVLAPVLKERGIDHLVHLNVVPAGNAELKLDEKTGSMKMVCQHGEEECEGNKILLCMSDVYGSDPKFLQTFECMEKSDAADPAISQIIDTNTTLSFIHRLSRACMTSQGLDSDSVMSCADGDKGQLLAEMAINSTANLKPQYEYSPWVVVDGKPIKEDAYSLKEYVCDAYQGALPLECSPAMLKDYYPRKSTLRGKHVQRLQGKHSSKLHSADGKLDSAVQRDLSLEASEQSHGGAAEGARSRHSTKGHVQALMGRGSFFQKCLPDMH